MFWTVLLAAQVLSDPGAADLSWHQAPGPQDATRPPSLADETGAALSTFARDSAYLATAPLRPGWEGAALLAAGAGTVALVTTQDEDIRDWFRRHQRSRWIDFSHEADRALLPKQVLPSMALLAAVPIVTDDARLRRTSLEVIEAAFDAELAVQAVKFLAGRSRPLSREGPHDWHPARGGASFPSGHTALAFSAAAVIDGEYAGAGLVTYPLAAIVGVSRVDIDAHWASDVVASAILSIAVGRTLTWLHARETEPALLPWLTRTDDGHAPALGWELRF